MFNNTCYVMATVNFSVPEDVKQAFDEAFAGQNKSAILSQLMRDAVAELHRRQARDEAVQQILDRHTDAPVRSAKQLDTSRKLGRS